MSQRANKRPNRCDDGSVPVKRRKRTAAEEEEAAAAAQAWQSRPNDLKTIYNRTTTEAPAELFRKDLISAMKLPDSEPLASNEYWVIVDQWKQEWERGVQVPVNPDSLPEPSVTVTHCANAKHEFKLPKNKYIRITKDDNFQPDMHALSNAPTQAEAACSYDLDEVDTSWLRILNAERARSTLAPVSEDQLERIIEQFELTCWDKIQTILRNEEGLGIEYDENVICDVCRSPDSEEGNEMVFCDSCNICVHQACYGITKIPEGQWLCCTCKLGKRPKCALCPNKGGAMKCTRSGQKWAHVSCALWIPEVSIGCAKKMEPITKISSIPASRWALICVLCRERVGACIQCSVKTCKTAYHVTCAFKHGLEMRAIIEDENADDGVKLRSYCEKHSKSGKKEKSVCSGSEDDDSRQRKKRKDLTSEEKNQARAARLQEIEAEFHRHVSLRDVSIHPDVDHDALHDIYNYWKLKRKAGNHNKPLLPPKSEDNDLLSQKREQADLEKMKMFVQLRQDLERVRNLCYMVSRREKLSRSFFRLREQTFHKQAAVLRVSSNLSTDEVQSVIDANHGPSIYDRLYSHYPPHDQDQNDDYFERMVARIAGVKSPPSRSDDDNKKAVNGLFKDLKNNPYKKVYVNGASSKRRSVCATSTEASSAEDEKPPTKDNKENRLRSEGEAEEKVEVKEEKVRPAVVKKRPLARKNNNNNNNERRNKRLSNVTIKVESSTEDDDDNVKPPVKKWDKSSRSRLVQVERELGYSASDSDELMPIIRNQHTKNTSCIYSDSDDTASDVSTRNDDAHQRPPRTKAAVKEFSHKPSTSSSSGKNAVAKQRRKSVKESGKRTTAKDYVPSDLIVPQRQAAKKATENLKTTRVTTTVAPTNKDPPEDPKPPPEDKKVKGRPKTTTTTTTTTTSKDTITTSPTKPDTPSSKKDRDISTTTTPSNNQHTKSDIFDLDKEFTTDATEILAYVPQRQAAKKAAEHIKSGLGKPAASAAAQASAEAQAEGDGHGKKVGQSPRKENCAQGATPPAAAPPPAVQTKRKSSTSSSSTSSSSDNSSSSGSSSTESEEEETSRRKSSVGKATSAPPPRPETTATTTTTTTNKRANAKDWPFLDKAAKPSALVASSSSGANTSDEDEDDETTQQQQQRKQPPPTPTPRKTTTTTTSGGGTRGGRGVRQSKSQSSRANQRVRSSNVRHGDLSDCKRGDVVPKSQSSPSAASVAKATKEGKGVVGSSVTPTAAAAAAAAADVEQQKTVKADDYDDYDDSQVVESVSDLEREILERKAGKQGAKTRSALDKLFGPPDDDVSEPSEEPPKAPLGDDDSNKVIEIEDEEEEEEEVVVVKRVATPPPPSRPTTKEATPPPPISMKEAEPPGRSIFSPPHLKDLDFDDHLDDGFGIITSRDEEMMLKVPLTFNLGNTSLFKEDTKEDSARETLNLVEKLRMELSKKSTGDVDDTPAPTPNNKPEPIPEFTEQVVPTNHTPERPPTGQSKPIMPPPPPINHHHHQQPISDPIDDIPSADLTSQGDERWVPPSTDLPYPVVPPHPLLPYQLSHYHHHQYSSSSLPSASPYGPDIHPQAKWAESELMPNRRSSSSSAASSSSSSCSRANDGEEAILGGQSGHLDTLVVGGYLAAAPPDSLGLGHVDAQQQPFIGPVSLFPPLAPPQPLYPPQFGAPFPLLPPPPSSVIGQQQQQSVAKGMEEGGVAASFGVPSTAAFTSSQHNMALTAAMVNMQPVVEEPAEPSVPQPMASPSIPPLKPPPPHAGKKSPSKPTRTSARVTSLSNKSPSKSPMGKSPMGKSPMGKSPRQDIVVNNRGRGRGERGKNGARGAAGGTARGRGRGRGRSGRSDLTIHNSLVGTVYDLDFDDDHDSTSMSDLRSMRERRKSVDVTERKTESLLRPPTPANLHESASINSTTPSPHPPITAVAAAHHATSQDTSKLFPTMVHHPVLLPGPVDMRTYNTFDHDHNNHHHHQQHEQQIPGYSGAQVDHSLVLHAFGTGTTEPPEREEIDEDFEKELQSALTSSSSTVVNNNNNNNNNNNDEVVGGAQKQQQQQQQQQPEVNNIKVALSDSRNQLKVKIKGPIANNNSAPQVPPPPVATHHHHHNSSLIGGPSELPRMRKKELLRVYWTQDMNMDGGTGSGYTTVPPTTKPVNRTIITIPKAVASMTSIPTKEDYRDYRTGCDGNKKEAKRPLARELADLHGDEWGDRRRGSVDSANKRRGRPPRLDKDKSATPKIRIKLGNNSNSIVGGVDDKKDRIRPPKKRLANTLNNSIMPTVEDLKRESMKYRKMVMADFGGLGAKEKKKKRDRKKRKRASLQIETQKINPTKLIIRIGKKQQEGCVQEEEVPPDVVDCVQKLDDVKMTPIKLKLSRCQKGGSYVMNKGGEANSNAPPLIGKDCEVR